MKLNKCLIISLKINLNNIQNNKRKDNLNLNLNFKNYYTMKVNDKDCNCNWIKEKIEYFENEEKNEKIINLNNSKDEDILLNKETSKDISPIDDSNELVNNTVINSIDKSSYNQKIDNILEFVQNNFIIIVVIIIVLLLLYKYSSIIKNYIYIKWW